MFCTICTPRVQQIPTQLLARTRLFVQQRRRCERGRTFQSTRSYIIPISKLRNHSHRSLNKAPQRSMSSSSVTSNSNETTLDQPNTSKADNNNNNDDDVVTMSTDDQGICTIVLNRPKKLNALNFSMFHQLRNILHTILLQQQQRPRPNAPQIRVILVRGEGRAFCTGLDVPSILRHSYSPFQTTNELLQRHPLDVSSWSAEHPKAAADNPTIQEEEDRDPEERPPDVADAVKAIALTTNLVQDVGYLWRQVSVPVICCIHGMCFGGGLQIALGADIRFVAETAQLSILESKWGLIPDMSATVTLRELVRIDIAKELTYTGRIVSGEDAVRYGLATHCVEDPYEAGQRLAQQLIEKSPDVLHYTKQLYQQTWNTGVSEEYCLQLESKYQRQLLLSYNQIAASLRNFGWKLPYFTSKKKT